MLKAVGNIWSFYDEGRYIVIPTNLGWKKNGIAVMGAGLAEQARNRFPGLDERYGEWLQYRYENQLSGLVWEWKRLILFPTIPLNPAQPWLSWKNDASLELIEKALEDPTMLFLLETADIVFPWIGTGLGNLARKDVWNLLQKLDNRHYLIEFSGEDKQNHND